MLACRLNRRPEKASYLLKVAELCAVDCVCLTMFPYHIVLPGIQCELDLVLITSRLTSVMKSVQMMTIFGDGKLTNEV